MRVFRSPSYYKRLKLFFLISTLPGLLIGIVMYQIVKGQIEESLLNIHHNTVTQTIQTIDGHLANTEMYLTHWVFDSVFKENMEQMDVAKEYNRVHEFYRTLLVMEGSSPLIASVELYVDGDRPILFKKDGYRRIDPAANTFNTWMDEPRSLYWAKMEQSLSLIHKLPGLSSGNIEPYGALAVHLDKEEILKYLRALSPYPKGVAQLYDETGTLLFASGDDEIMNSGDWKERTPSAEQADSDLFRWNGATYTVIQGTMNRLGKKWIYISAVPVSSITAPITLASKIVFATSILVLLLTGIYAWLASRKLYSPLSQLLGKMSVTHHPAVNVNRAGNEFEWIEGQWNELQGEHTKINSRLEAELPQLRDGFLIQLLQGRLYNHTEQECYRRMYQYGWDLSKRKFTVALVQLRKSHMLRERYGNSDDGLVSFAAANMLEELLKDAPIEVKVINFHDLSVGVFMVFPNEWNENRIKVIIRQLGEKIMSQIEQVLRLPVTIGIGQVINSLMNVSDALEQAQFALQLRDLQETSQLIDMDIMRKEEQQLHYPFAIEKEITYALRLGNEEEAIINSRRFLLALQEENVTEGMLKTSVQQLLGQILHIVIQVGIDIRLLYGKDDLYAQFAYINEPNEIAAWLENRVIRPFIKERLEMKDGQSRKWVDATIAILQEEYMKDISIEYCADLLGISHPVLSKAFKKITGQSYTDYLTNVRMEKAKELLKTTEQKISDIAEQIGYQSSYFNRVFKRFEGVTPGQYREKYK